MLQPAYMMLQGTHRYPLCVIHTHFFPTGQASVAPSPSAVPTGQAFLAPSSSAMPTGQAFLAPSLSPTLLITNS